MKIVFLKTKKGLPEHALPIVYIPIAHHHRDVVVVALLQQLVHIVHGKAGHKRTVDLQYLVAKAQTRQRSRTVLYDHAHKNALIDRLHPQADLLIRTLAHYELLKCV